MKINVQPDLIENVKNIKNFADFNQELMI